MIIKVVVVVDIMAAVCCSIVSTSTRVAITAVNIKVKITAGIDSLKNFLQSYYDAIVIDSHIAIIVVMAKFTSSIKLNSKALSFSQ